MSRFAISGLSLANVKDYGATGDGVTDDRVAIQAAIDDAIAVGLGGIFFPQGTYNVSLAGLTVTAPAGFHIKGQGEASVVQFLAEDQGGAARTLLLLTGGSEVFVSTLVLNGNKANVTNAAVTSRLLEVNNMTDVVVDRVLMQNSTGRAATAGIATRLAFTSCMVSANDNSGLFFDDASFVRVADCDFFGNAIVAPAAGGDILINPANAGADFVIEGNTIDHSQNDFAIFKAGITPVPRLVIANNTILGAVRLENQNGCVLSDNFIRVIDAAGEGTGRALELDTCSNVLFKDNHVETNNTAGFAIIDSCADCSIDGNFWNAAADAPTQFDIDSSTSLEIANNIMIGGADGGSELIRIQTTSAVSDDIWIHDNKLETAASSGIEVTPTTSDVGRISIQDNFIADETRFLAGAGAYTASPIYSGNWGSSGSGFNTVDLANLPEPYIVVGGSFSRGTTGSLLSGAQQLMGLGDPEGVVTGSEGDTYVRVDGAGVPRFFFKKSGTNTNTGWASVGAAIVNWGVSNVAASADTRYLSPGFTQATATTTSNSAYRVPRAGTLQNFRVRHNNANGNGNSVVYDVLINTAASGLGLSLASGAVGDASDLVTAIPVAAGDLIEITATKALSIGSGDLDAMFVAEFVG